MSSAANVEIYRCSDCRETVLIVPAGFSVNDQELDKKTKDHLKQCKAKANGVAT